VVSKVYRSLADYAAGLADSPDTPPEPHTLAGIRPLQTDPQPFARSNEVLVFVALLDEAERIRTSLAALALAAPDERREVTDHLTPILRELASAVEEGRAPESRAREWSALNLRAGQAGSGVTPLRTLLGQVRAACRTASVPAVEAPDAASPPQRPRTVSRTRDAMMTIRANLTLRSTAFRHALRLAATLAFATAAYRLAGLPRGYWFPMTALLVLKPEYRETFVTGITRITATLAGAALASAIVGTLGAHPAILWSLLLFFVWSGYAIFRANYALFTISMTGYVVVLLQVAAGTTGPMVAAYRALDTALGGALALLVYRVWPTWEAGRTRDLLARFSDSLAADARLVLGMYVNPATWDPAALQQSRAAARLARSNAEASVTRMLEEPDAARTIDSSLATSLLAAFRRYALGALVLHAALARPPAAASPALALLREQLADALTAIGRSLRSGHPPDALPPLAETQSALESTLDRHLTDQTAMMVDSVTAVAGLLRA
jgi:uncharacterized membrane protein YccC